MNYVDHSGNGWRPVLRIAALAAVIASVTACNAVYELFYEEYDGPLPEAEALVDEPVIARIVKRGDVPSPAVAVIYADRVKYLRENDPHNINRVVYLELRTLRVPLDTTQLRPGDTLRVSTQYDGRIYLEGPLREIPDWPYPRRTGGEYPIGRHTVTEYRR
ncbi:MAG TPA: hypothetical protein VE913_19750 [Longimicrobium sp.]|nr:hypothetical protein [Longimicrobium sp.]